MIMVLPLALMACGGSSGGGGGGAAVDNSKASGTYSFVVIEGTSVKVGSVTLDGAGGGTSTDISPTPGATEPLTYTAYSDNSITIEGVNEGNIRSGGSFIVLSNTNSGDEALILLVKNSATPIDDIANSYRFGQFGHDGSSSETVIVDVVSDGAGLINWSTIAPAPNVKGTDTYTFDNNSSGTYMITAAGGGADDAYGAVSPDGQICIYGDGDSTDPPVHGALGLEFPAISLMTVADFSGTYIMHQFMDNEVEFGPSFSTARFRVVSNGDGTGTYASIASSVPGSSFGDLNYTVNDDGSMTVFGGDGFLLADGSVYVFVDHDTSGDDLDIKVAVRQ